ncbi:hypothetical protein D0T84_16835 [Dysgonomonas sp. 521]|uniref:hypothetical protein n=1 Tax=Dysgonomonas sp. 521 TaxID=2302932 RepID=UPI0013D74CF9|nr:hypothetical protein [Dysgonomonas sp. 521]NDV96568.1 hypothetical protein [Dysgonomonas sp. 521]
MNKLLTIILMLSLSVAFGACSSDDDKTEEFVWNGNWNDPSDLNYKPNGYNPIQGLWRKVEGDIGFYNSDDFKTYQIKFLANGDYTQNFYSGYIINDKAFKYTDTSDKGAWRYKVEGDLLYIYPNRTSDDDVRKYERVEEK